MGDRCSTDNSVALGLVSSYTMGVLIYILLVIAIVVVLIRIIQGLRVV